MSASSAAFVDGAYIPVGNDSFYHAHRILMAAQDLSSFYEFDPRIHAPEGSLLIWPWGYDYVMAVVVKGLISVRLATDPVHAMDLLPVAAVPISVGLLIGIGVSIGLELWSIVLLVICMVFSPLTQILHGIGCVDHHFAEYLFVLAGLLSGLGWLKAPESLRRATVAGIVLGLAPAVHNGLFIVQLPLLLSLGLLWLRGDSMPRRSSIAFISSLLLATLLVLLPSEPFREWRFEFYLLSWFHLYVALCTSAVILFLAFNVKSARTIAAVIVLSLALVVPLLGQAVLGKQFVSGQLQMLDQIEEAKSVLAMWASNGSQYVLRYYSGLILLAPLTIAGCVWVIARHRAPAHLLFFWTYSAFGLLLLIAMFRMHNYGSFALYLPLLLAGQHLAQRSTAQRSAIKGLLAMVVILSYGPPVRAQLFVPMAPGNDFYYGLTRGVYPAMATECAKAPGIVLATPDDGHYITYHTGCSVIANNFLMTPQHDRKVQDVRHLMSLSAMQLLESGAQVRYVFVRFTNLFTRSPQGKPVIGTRNQLLATNDKLVGELLLANQADIDPRYRMITERRFTDSDGFAYARLFEVLPRKRN